MLTIIFKNNDLYALQTSLDAWLVGKSFSFYETTTIPQFGGTIVLLITYKLS